MRFDIDKFAAALEIACVTAVRRDMKLEIPMNADEVFRIMNCFRKWNRDEFHRYIDEMRPYFKEAKYTKTFKVVMVRMDPRLQWLSIMAIDEAGEDKHDFEIGRRITKWFGVNRARAVKFGEFIPQDPRDGMYDGNQYDGTDSKNFVLDNIGTEFMDKGAMTSAVVNSKWNRDCVKI